MNFWESLISLTSYPQVFIAYVLLVTFFVRDLVMHNHLTPAVLFIRLYRWVLVIALMLLITNTIDYQTSLPLVAMDYAVNFLALSSMPVSLVLAFLYLRLQERILVAKRKDIKATIAELAKEAS